MNNLGPFPKFIYDPAKIDMQTILPCPTGDYFFGSKSIVSVSHATILFFVFFNNISRHALH